MLGIMVIPAAVFALLVRTIPESPRWLVFNGDEEAKKIFERKVNMMRVIKENMN